MENIYVYLFVVIAIIVVGVVSQKMSFNFFGLKVTTDNRSSRNKAVINGNKNKLGQGESRNTLSFPVDNDLNIKGDDNDIKQG